MAQQAAKRKVGARRARSRRRFTLLSARAVSFLSAAFPSPRFKQFSAALGFFKPAAITEFAVTVLVDTFRAQCRRHGPC